MYKLDDINITIIRYMVNFLGLYPVDVVNRYSMASFIGRKILGIQ